MSDYDRNAVIPGAPVDQTLSQLMRVCAPTCSEYITTWPLALA